MRKISLLFSAFLLCGGLVFAQQRTVTGKVTDEKGDPVPFASVKIKGSNKGVSADVNGNFIIDVSGTDPILIASSQGFSTQELPVGNSSAVNFNVKSQGQLQEVVVTALGIKKEKKGLGYAVSDLKGSEINRTPNQNLVTSLNGKVAGLQVVSSGGAPGQAATVTIRGGAKSITGNNQPLFVVDGIPISNANDGNSATVTGAATPNRAADINADDIESISVLKGSAASVLYGNRGSNGVILITTKAGKARQGKPVVTVSSSTGFDNVLILPDYQTTYAQGSNQNYAEGGSRSFGPEITGQQVNSAAAGGSVTLSVHDPRKDFLKTGMTYNNNVSLSQTLDKTNFYFSAGNFKQTAIVPNQDYNRASVRFNITNQVSSRLSVGMNVNYTKTWGDVPYTGQDGNNPFFSLFHVPVSWDLNGYGYEKADGSQKNFRGGSFDNPLWTVNKTFFNTNNDHILGGANIGYKALSWLDFSYRLGIDQYTDNRKSFKDIFTGGNPEGFLANDIVKREELTSIFLANVNKRINNDFGFTLTAGQDFNQQKLNNYNQTGTALALPGIAHMNNVKSFNPDYEYVSKRRTIGVFGDLKFDYNNYLYLGITARNEWSSTLPVSNRSYFYPGVNASFVFSDAFNINKSILSFGKVRVGYAKTARDASVYQLQNVYLAATASDGFTSGVTFPFLGLPGYAVNTTVNNPALKPEITQEIEAGTELRFLHDRIGIDFTYFTNRNTDGIISLDVAPSTGASNVIVNSGRTTSQGIEVALNVTPIKTRDFSWEMFATFSRVRTKVKEIYKDLDKKFLGGFSGNPAIYAVIGQRYGSIIAAGYERDDAGNILTDDDGYPLLVDGATLGYVEPDWTGGLRNTFTYKKFRLDVLFDTRQGGYLFSGTSELLDNYGVSKRSAEGRYEDYIFPGVNQTTGKANDIPVVKDQNWWSYMAISDEAYVYKNNWVKLREANLSYSIDIKNSLLHTVDVGVYGRNLFLWTKVPDIDPESSSFGTGNGQGASRMAYPTTRSIGINLKFTF